METKKNCSNCFFKDFEKYREPCTNCYDVYTHSYRNYVTDSDDFWKDTPVKDTYQPSNGTWADVEVPIMAAYKEAKVWPYPEAQKSDMVDNPKHYMLFPEHGIEVRHLMKRLSEKIAAGNTPMTAMMFSDYVQSMQYFLRFMEKGGKQDLEKGIKYMIWVLEACV